MKEAIREMFLTDWVKEATTNEIVEKLIEHDERGKEIERLNNIINELEKWLKNKIDNFDRIVLDTTYHEQITIQLIYDYLQELKGE